MVAMGRPHRKRMRRFEDVRRWRYVTFSCHRRLQLLGNARIRDLFAASIARARQRCGFTLRAWVIMPEHVHMILSPQRREWPLAKILLSIKQPVAQVVIARWRELNARILQSITLADGRARFWQAGGGFDRNIRDQAELDREIAYIHANPVKRGLVENPTDWAWSSARWYAGIRDGQIPIDLVW